MTFAWLATLGITTRNLVWDRENGQEVVIKSYLFLYKKKLFDRYYLLKVRRILFYLFDVHWVLEMYISLMEQMQKIIFVELRHVSK